MSQPPIKQYFRVGIIQQNHIWYMKLWYYLRIRFVLIQNHQKSNLVFLYSCNFKRPVIIYRLGAGRREVLGDHWILRMTEEGISHS